MFSFRFPLLIFSTLRFTSVPLRCTARFLHVVDQGQMIKPYELMHTGSLIASYQQLNSIPRFAVYPPVWDDLEPGGFLSPLQVESLARRRTAGRRTINRIHSNSDPTVPADTTPQGRSSPDAIRRAAKLLPCK